MLDGHTLIISKKLKEIFLLKEYLYIAEHGLKDNHIDNLNKLETSLEEDVASVIKEAGYEVALKMGCGNYRIDIAVKHPHLDDYVLAIECDGKTYHSSLNARDRDRLRSEVLEKLGWKYYRIWSIDWFMNHENEKKLLLNMIDNAIKEYDRLEKEKENINKEEAETRYKEVEVVEPEVIDNIEVIDKKEEDNINKRFYLNIAKAIEGKKVVVNNEFESQTINEVLNLVNNQISYDAITQKKFKDKEEFNQFKHARKIIYSFFGVMFSLGYISLTKAQEIYAYYVATKIIDKIREYERILNVQIITDEQALLNSLQGMIKGDDVAFMRCEGINSNFALIPEAILIELLNKYLSLIKNK